jgi:hypothetical protein
VFAVGLAACGGGDPTSGEGGDGVDNFTAQIDGQPWNAEVAPTANNFAPGSWIITAIRTTGANPLTLVLNLNNITGPGTYPLGVLDQMFGGWAQILGPQRSYAIWSTEDNGAAGQITISTLSATQIVGTFSFTAHPELGTVASGVRTVTDGAFDIPVTGGGGVAPPNRGSSVTATIGTSPFVASEATNTLTNGGSPLLTIVASNFLIPSTTQVLHFSLASITGAGTYALSDVTPPLRTITWGYTAGSQVAGWSSAGGSGTVTISSLTAERIVGTFTATLIGHTWSGVPGPLPPISISGSFSLGRGP